jgi:hypothetical protein
VKFRPAVALEVLGALCLVIAAALVTPVAAFVVAGLALIAKAWELDVTERSKRPPSP